MTMVFEISHVLEKSHLRDEKTAKQVCFCNTLIISIIKASELIRINFQTKK